MHGQHPEAHIATTSSAGKESTCVRFQMIYVVNSHPKHSKRDNPMMGNTLLKPYWGGSNNSHIM